MNIQAWNSIVKKNKENIKEYIHLFEPTTPYRCSPFDGIALLSNEKLSPEFQDFITTLGGWRPISENKSPYKYMFTLGPVTVLTGKKYNMADVKIRINPSRAGLSLQQTIDWVRFIIGNENHVSVSRVDFKIDTNINITGAIYKVWWESGFRSVNDSYSNETLYLGGKRSCQQLVVYDKAKEMGIEGNLTLFRHFQ